MTTSRTGQTLLEVGRAVHDLTLAIDDPMAPGLGVWNVGALAGHLLRAFRTPTVYLTRPPAAIAELPDAAGYFIAYLERRDHDPGATDGAVAERGTRELGDVDPDVIVAAYEATLTELEHALAEASDGFIVASPFGGIERDDYLDTRILEATVHGIDLARALGRDDWRPPVAAVERTLQLLVAVAMGRGRGADLLMALTGRSDAVRPVLE